MSDYGVSLVDPFKLLLRKNEAVIDLCVKNCSLEESSDAKRSKS